MQSTCDTVDQRPDAAQVLAAPWRSYGGHARFSGPAATVRCFNDNTVVRQVLETPGEGRVLVVDGAGSITHALLGDRVAGLAVQHGWSGIVVFGAVRDSAALRELELGVVALGTVPRPSRKEGAGVADVPLTVAGATIKPGDRIVADEDGVVAVPATLAG